MKLKRIIALLLTISMLLTIVPMVNISAADMSSSVTIGAPVAVTAGDTTKFTCETMLPGSASYVTVSVDSGSFLVPSVNGLTFNYATNGTKLYTSYSASQPYQSVTFEVTDTATASEALSKVIYTKSDAPMNIEVSVLNDLEFEEGDVFYGGHIYRYVSSRCSWLDAVKNAHNTTAYGENGYLANITSANENTMVLKMIQTGTNRYNGTWIGGTSCYVNSECTTQYTYERIAQGITDNNFIKYYKKSVNIGSRVHEEYSGNDFYWIDGPEAGQTLPSGSAYWHSVEPNTGYCVWMGYQGPYWDDLYNISANNTDTRGYLIEFGGMSTTSELASSETSTKKEVTTYTVTFDAQTNGGSFVNAAGDTVGIDSVTIYGGEAITIPSVEARNGYTFDGWFTEAEDGTRISLGQEGDTYTPTMSSTLYAQFIIANMFEQTIDENGYVKQGEHKLAEIDCIPSNSLEIVNDEITMSDEYPVVGEPTTISFTVKNTGLLPSTGQDVAIKVLRDGKVVFEDSQRETEASDVIFVGNEFEYSTEWIPESLDGDIEIIAEIAEHGTNTVHTATKKLEKGANIDFGLSYEWNWDKIFNEIRTYPQDTPEESMSAEAKAINDIMDDESITAFNHIVFIPVENTGNAPMSNITANAVHIDKEFNKGDTLGTSKAINLAAKESGLLAIPVKGGEEHYTKDGIMELMLTVNSGETELDWGNLHETIFESENVGVIANDGIETKEMKQNETFTIEARAYPFDNMKKMYYFSFDPAVAQVSEDGVVTAVGGGTTTVFALDMVSGISDEIEVTVEGTEPTPTRKPSSGGGSSSKKTPAPTASAEPTTEPTATPNPTSEPSGEENNWFADVPQDVWYYDAVKAVFDRKLMVGVDDTHFEPETDVTRGMFVTTLYRLENEPEISTEYTFNDVAQDAYYANAVAWANANGIVEGYSESEFAPDEKITREQMATMIYRYVQYKGEGFTDDWMFMLGYVDSADVSEYAYEAMCWNTMNGIINGMDDNTLSPKTNSTRAQVAAVLVRLADVLENNKQ